MKTIKRVDVLLCVDILMLVCYIDAEQVIDVTKDTCWSEINLERTDVIRVQYDGSKIYWKYVPIMKKCRIMIVNNFEDTKLCITSLYSGYRDKDWIKRCSSIFKFSFIDKHGTNPYLNCSALATNEYCHSSIEATAVLAFSDPPFRLKSDFVIKIARKIAPANRSPKDDDGADTKKTDLDCDIYSVRYFHRYLCIAGQSLYRKKGF
ncbi:hypothetical protein MAR_011622, partial [Mya arenaria]